VFRVATRVAQSVPAESEAIRAQYAVDVMTGVKLRNVMPAMLANMDETWIFFDAVRKKTINIQGAKTVPLRKGSTYSPGCTFAPTVAHDGTKLAPFVVMKAKHNGRIEKKMYDWLPAGMHGCCAPKGFVDNRAMGIWYERVWKPYAEATNNSFLLLDHWKPHHHASFTTRAAEINTCVSEVPAGQTSVSQPCDVALMKTIKHEYYKKCKAWKRQERIRLGPQGSMPRPTREHAVIWIMEVWNELDTELVKTAFKKCGFDYAMELDVEDE